MVGQLGRSAIVRQWNREGERLVGILTEHDVLKALRPDIGPDSSRDSNARRTGLRGQGVLP
jgi:hypothetical protein